MKIVNANNVNSSQNNLRNRAVSINAVKSKRANYYSQQHKQTTMTSCYATPTSLSLAEDVQGEYPSGGGVSG